MTECRDYWIQAFLKKIVLSKSKKPKTKNNLGSQMTYDNQTNNFYLIYIEGVCVVTFINVKNGISDSNSNLERVDLFFI